MADVLHKLFSEKQIKGAVKRLADSISSDFDDEEVLFVCILKGSFIFTSDLVRMVKGPAVIDFIRASSYGYDSATCGKVTFTKDLETDIAGKNVILVEDIIDSGLTLRSIRDMLLSRRPKSLKICALVDKRGRREVEIEGDYVGFTIDDGFIVGYGIDYAEKYRNLPEIFVVEEAKG